MADNQNTLCTLTDRRVSFSQLLHTSLHDCRGASSAHDLSSRCTFTPCSKSQPTQLELPTFIPSPAPLSSHHICRSQHSGIIIHHIGASSALHHHHFLLILSFFAVDSGLFRSSCAIIICIQHTHLHGGFVLVLKRKRKLESSLPAIRYHVSCVMTQLECGSAVGV